MLVVGESGKCNFSLIINDNDPTDFLVTANALAEISAPSQTAPDQDGNWTETP